MGELCSGKLRATFAKLRVRLITLRPHKVSGTRLTIYQTDRPTLTSMPLDYDTGLTRQIIGLAMRVHTRVGPGLLESVYERCLCHELELSGLPFARQVDLPLRYDAVHLDCGYRADIIVGSEVLLELKSVEFILPLHEAQLQTYLRFSGCKVGLLLFFIVVSLKYGSRRRVFSGN